MEKLYKFFEFTLDMSEIRIMYNVKHKFNDDLNLFGCFIKDFLTIKNEGLIPDDESVYDSFVLWFEKVLSCSEDAVKEICEYADYYSTIVFEKTEDKKLQGVLSTINECFAIDCYPNLMELFKRYYANEIDINEFYAMLDTLTDIVLKRYENLSGSVLTYMELERKINSSKLERAVV